MTTPQTTEKTATHIRDTTGKPPEGSRAGRLGKGHLVAATSIIPAGMIARHAGRAAGRIGTGYNDPQYAMNYQQGRQLYHKRAQGMSEDDLEENNKVMAGIIGGGAAYAGAKGYQGFKQGRWEKRQSAINHGFDDEYRRYNYTESDDMDNPFLTEEILQEFRVLPKVSFKHKLGAGLIGAGALGATAYGGKRVLDKATESDEFQEIGATAGKWLSRAGTGLMALDLGMMGKQGVDAIRNRKKDQNAASTGGFQGQESEDPFSEENELVARREEQPFYEDELYEREQLPPMSSHPGVPPGYSQIPLRNIDRKVLSRVVGPIAQSRGHQAIVAQRVKKQRHGIAKLTPWPAERRLRVATAPGFARRKESLQEVKSTARRGMTQRKVKYWRPKPGVVYGGAAGLGALGGAAFMASRRRKEDNDPFGEELMVERFRGQAAARGVDFAQQYGPRAQQALSHYGTVRTGHGKYADFEDDRKFNFSN